MESYPPAPFPAATDAKIAEPSAGPCSEPAIFTGVPPDGVKRADDIHNTGLDATITDVGAGGGTFKVPSLRNVAVRGRYMHDGRFTSLDQVVAFYDSGVQPNPGLDPRLVGGRGGQPQRLNLTAAERAALVAFLGTLTDQTFLNDVRFASPFPR